MSIVKVLICLILAAVGIYFWKMLFELLSPEMPFFLKKVVGYAPQRLQQYTPLLTMANLTRVLTVLLGIFLFFFLIAQIETLIGHPLFEKREKKKEEPAKETEEPEIIEPEGSLNTEETIIFEKTEGSAE